MEGQDSTEKEHEEMIYWLLSLSVTEIRFVILYEHQESAFIKQSSISSAAASFDNEENNTSDSILSSSRGGHQSYQSTEMQQKQRVSSSLEYWSV